MTEQKMVRLPGDLLDRAGALVDALRAKTAESSPWAGAAAQWSTAAVARLALEWGLTYLEQRLESGGELTAPTAPKAKKPAAGADTVRIQYRDTEESGGVAVSPQAQTPKTKGAKK